MPEPAKKSFIINEGLRIRDPHEVVLDFVVLDQPVNDLSGDATQFKYSLVFGAAMMIMAKFLFSIHVPKVVEVIAALAFAGVSIYLLFTILESYNKAVQQYAWSTMALYLLIGMILFLILGLF